MRCRGPLEQHVVAKQIRVHRSARQHPRSAAQTGIPAPMRADRAAPHRETACTSRAAFAPPARPARILEGRPRSPSPARCMAASMRADLARSAAARVLTDAPGRRVTSVAGLPFSVPRKASSRSAIGAGQGMPCCARCAIRFEVERQLFGAKPFEQREHVASLGGGDEIIGILDAGGNAPQLDAGCRRNIASAKPRTVRR